MLILPVALTTKNLPPERSDNADNDLPVLPTLRATTGSESFKIVSCSII